jgi:hypothetical protein
VLAVLAVAISALPASMVGRLLPAALHAEDFSGTVWHGSAGRITLATRDAGALEWRLQPQALLKLGVAAELHWVKGGFVLDGTAEWSRQQLRLSQLDGGGPIGDLRDFGVAPGWRGSAAIHMPELTAVITASGPEIRSALGDISVSNLSSPQVAAGADLGGYTLHLSDAAIAPDGELSGELSDSGGPLELAASLHFSARERRGLLSGAVRERADAPAALHAQLDQLAQLHARDPQGRIPVDLEFTL